MIGRDSLDVLIGRPAGGLTQIVGAAAAAADRSAVCAGVVDVVVDMRDVIMTERCCLNSPSVCLQTVTNNARQSLGWTSINSTSGASDIVSVV